MANKAMGKKLAQWMDGVLRQQAMIFCQPMAFHLFRDEVQLGNGNLVLDCVSRDANHFHPVPQCGWDTLQVVCSSNKQHLGEVEWEAQIMVDKVCVLLRVQDLKKGCHRVTMYAR